jgi:tRNA G18 (ribose-2'-O)-methylase SpoU
MRKLSHAEIVNRQVSQSAWPPVPLVLVLDNIRSLHNVGAIFRTADGVGLQKIWLCGITGFPPRVEIRKTALGAEERVPWEYARDTLSVVKRLKEEGYEIVILEQAEGAVAFENFFPARPVCLVVGNEVEGIADAVCALGDAAVEIEMRGIKNSLNVAVAFGVVAFHLRASLMAGARPFPHPVGGCLPSCTTP